MGAIIISMRPMKNSPFFIPLVLTRELYGISFAKKSNSWGNIDIVRNQNRLTGRKGNYEFLMSATAIVVW